MLQFNCLRRDELKDFLYNSCIHDAQIKNIRYDWQKRSFVLETFNPTLKIPYDIKFIFVNPQLVFSTHGDWHGSRVTIQSLTLKEDYLCLQNSTRICDDSLKDSLYLLFQMFSGDELHIVSKELFISASSR